MAQRAGRAIRDMQNYREPERIATTTNGIHFVPTVVFGEFAMRDIPEELRSFTAPGPVEPAKTWNSYPAR